MTLCMDNTSHTNRLKKIQKTFWQYVKAKNMTQNKLYQIKDPEGIVHYDDIGKDNILI